MSSDKASRIRRASTRLTESDEAIAKRLKLAHQQRNEPEISPPIPPIPIVSRQPSTSSLRSVGSSHMSHSRSPPASVQDVDDDDFEFERHRPRPKKADRLVEASDGSDDDVEDVDMDEVEATEDLRQQEEGEKAEPDPQALLDELYKTYKSPVYVFYLPPVFKLENGKRYQVFQCAAKQCTTPGGHIIKRNMDSADATSTSNLKGHAIKCYGKETVDAAMGTGSLATARSVLKDKKNLRSESITVAFQRKGKEKVTYSNRMATPLESCANHVRWMSESKRPFSIVSDEGYQRNMKTGRPEQYIPSPATISRDVKKVFAGARERIAHLLQNHKGLLNFATDCWTSPNRRAYMAVTVQYETKGVVDEWLLDIVEVGRSHTGIALAVEFTKILDDFGIAEKILSVTCDNATNNDVMIEEMCKKLAYFDGQASRVRCFAHVVNLVAKSIISQFDLPKKKKHTGDPEDIVAGEGDEANGEYDGEVEEGLDATLAGGDENLQAELAEVRELAEGISRDMRAETNEVPPEEREVDEEDGWIDERWAMDAEDLQELTKNVMPARRMLVRLRKISYALKNSPTIVTPRWRELCKTCNVKDKNMPRDVRTRWNSTYEMLEFAVEYREVINLLTSDRTAKLRAYEVHDDEWEIAKQLCDILKVFKDATSFFSKSKVSNISTVIPAMDHLDQKLTTIMVSPAKYSIAIRAAVQLGKNTLNRYYSKTDMSEAYRIAMVLDPRYKLNYFRNAGWTEEWIDTAHQLVKDELTKYSEPTLLPLDSNSIMIDNPQLHDGYSTSKKSTNMFNAFINSLAPSSAANAPADELALYLSKPVESLPPVDEDTPPNPLTWWWSERNTYPKLSALAMDYLCIPGSAVDVERVFSRGRIVLPYLRNRLKVQTVRSLMCVEEWLKAGLIEDKHLHGWLRGLQDIDEEDEADVDEGWDHISK